MAQRGKVKDRLRIRRKYFFFRFPRQEYWRGCHFLLQGIFPTLGTEPVSCVPGRFFTI